MRNVTDTEYFDFKNRERPLLHFGQYSLETMPKKNLLLGPRRYKNKCFKIEFL